MTAAYASPEPLRGESVTRRSDVFSLGGGLYEALAGERLFNADVASLLANETLAPFPNRCQPISSRFSKRLSPQNPTNAIPPSGNSPKISVATSTASVFSLIRQALCIARKS